MRWLRAVFSASPGARHRIILRLKRSLAEENFERIFDDFDARTLWTKGINLAGSKGGKFETACARNVASFVPFSELEISRNYFEGELLERSKSKLPMSRL
jgi:hypothetical protein